MQQVLPIASTKLRACRNSGAVTVSATGSGQQIEACTAAGVAGEVNTAVSCSNTGKVRMHATIGQPNPAYSRWRLCACSKISKQMLQQGCGQLQRRMPTAAFSVGGVSGNARMISQSYNKGCVTLKIPSAKSAEENKVGGVCGTVTEACVTATTRARLQRRVWFLHRRYFRLRRSFADDKVVSNYNTGKIKATTKGTYEGQVLAAVTKENRGCAEAQYLQ